MMTKKLFDLFDRERAKLDNFCLWPIESRHKHQGIVSIVQLHDEPGGVVAVQAPKTSMRQKVRAGLLEDFDGPKTCRRLFFVRDFNVKAWHDSWHPFS
jgi:hypothetical protein